IRTPLNGIIGFTKELKETKLSEEQVEIVDIIEESSENLIHIVNGILDFSKIKAGKIELEDISFNPIEKFEVSIDTYVAKAREKEIELKVCIDPHIPLLVYGDPTKISQVLNNLISNAIKFTPNKGTVEIEISQKSLNQAEQNVALYFSVKDSGIGVTEEEKKKIFDAFSQADPSTNREYGGTGLGLSIASQFVKKMGGKLDIKSQVAQGSTFFFTLNLKLPKVSKSHQKKDLTRYTVGYIPPLDNRNVDKNLKTYTEYQGATFLTYTQKTLLNLRDEEFPDLLFIDYKCFEEEGELDYFLDLPIKLVLIAADNREKELRDIRHKIDKILHRPVNFTRTLKALEILTQSQNKSSSKYKKGIKTFKNAHVLVAEDNLINQKLMKSILDRFGMKVTLVSNGKEALSARENNEYDIIFMDIQMPLMGGVEATQKILAFEEERQRRHIPIVALTANALEGDKEKYIASGMDAYLPKPMDIHNLEKVLTNYLK
ncbi:MAG TPA: response regulator, partial [Campylobacterales bacterium]|nr:response regulator [Campylobacterales bacterium]